MGQVALVQLKKKERDRLFQLLAVFQLVGCLVLPFTFRAHYASTVFYANLPVTQ